MNVDYLIIGQGLCGSFLSYFLQQQNASFIIIDDDKKNTSSKVASGVINPITGRRLVKTWMIDDILPFAINTYKKIEQQFNINIATQLDIIDFHTTPQMKLAFDERLLEEVFYLKKLVDYKIFDEHFNIVFGADIITNSWLIDVNTFLENIKKELLQNHQLIYNYFNIEKLTIKDDCLEYENIRANKIIFCDGVDGALNTYFKNLPYTPNKGEALIVSIPHLPKNNLYKYGISIIPWKEDLFWVGSSYEWNFIDDKPTKNFKIKTENTLKQILKQPFIVKEHLCAVRPANIERRPFVGFHPIYKNIGVFNGMGTKGCSLAPYFANEFVNHIVHQKPIDGLVDVKRFEKVLSR